MVATRGVGVELLGHFVPAMKNLKDIKTNKYKFTKSENQILQRWIVKKKGECLYCKDTNSTIFNPDRKVQNTKIITLNFFTCDDCHVLVAAH